VSRDPKHILLCVTSSVSAGFFDGQLRYLKQQGWTIAFAASADVPGQLARFGDVEGVLVHAFPLGRDIQPWRDARAFVRAVKFFLRERPTISNVGTPKAGLVMGLAAAVTGVPVRIYSLYGLRLETTTGLRRRVLEIAEMLAMAAAHRVVCISPSLRDQVVALGLANPDKVIVNGAGSVNGVSVPSATEVKRPQSASSPVIGFVGRLVPDKGVEDLVVAFEQVTRVVPDARLLLVTSLDETDPLSATTMAAIDADPRITLTGYVSDVSPYYEQMDVLALPSFREGLPTVLLEGAAHGLPTVASRATGSRDGFLAGRTGWAVSAGNPGEIADSLLACLSNPDEADARGKAGRAWVSANFARETVWENWNHIYRDTLEMRRTRGTRLKRAIDLTGAIVGRRSG
jgi:glycosyltransferase involved in cell wall biosynthesis